MTKVVRFWKRFSFWNKIRLTLGALGVKSEIILFVADSHPTWKIVAGIATFLTIAITYFIKDDNKNNIVDILE